MQSPISYSPSTKNMIRHVFTPAEDALLKRLVNQYGERSWKLISSMIPNRSPRQCRERYKGYLAPTILNPPWTAEEDKLLLEKTAQLGKKWAKIATYFNYRSDANIKNRYATLINRSKTYEKSSTELEEQENEASTPLYMTFTPTISTTPVEQPKNDEITSFPIPESNIRNLLNDKTPFDQPTSRQPVIKPHRRTVCSSVKISPKLPPPQNHVSKPFDKESNVLNMPNMFWSTNQSDEKSAKTFMELPEKEPFFTEDQNSDQIPSNGSGYRNFGGKLW